MWKFFLNPENFDYTNFNVKWILIMNTKTIHEKLKTIPKICIAVKAFLKNEYNEKLAKIYVQYYM